MARAILLQRKYDGQELPTDFFGMKRDQKANVSRCSHDRTRLAVKKPSQGKLGRWDPLIVKVPRQAPEQLRVATRPLGVVLDHDEGWREPRHRQTNRTVLFEPELNPN